MAQLNSLMGFEHLDLKPVALTDADGKTHEFHFRAYLFGSGVALDAFEIRGGHPGGYQFQIIGEPEEDLLVLLGRLIEKVRRGLSRKHLKKEKYGDPDRGSNGMRQDRVGRRPGWLCTAPQHRWP